MSAAKRVRTPFDATTETDAEWLANAGEITATAAYRLGYATLNAFIRALDRHGRRDLIAQFRTNAHQKGATIDGKPLRYERYVGGRKRATYATINP